MATAKKAAPKAAVKTVKKTVGSLVKKAPVKALKPAPVKVVKLAVKPAAVKKAPVSQTAKVIARINASLAKLSERKSKIDGEIKALKEQRADLKAAAALVATPAKAPVKAPAKAVKAAPRKTAKKK